MGPGFNQLDRVRAGFKPLTEAGSEERPEERAGADVGIEIALNTDPALVLLVVSRIGTVEGQLHEAGERNDLLPFDFLAQGCRDFSH